MPKTVEHLAATILTRIQTSFEDGHDGELLLTCPFDGNTSYDLYPTKDGTWNVVTHDNSEFSHPDDLGIKSLDAAKERVALLIAKQLLAAQEMVNTAKHAGIDLQ